MTVTQIKSATDTTIRSVIGAGGRRYSSNAYLKGEAAEKLELDILTAKKSGLTTKELARQFALSPGKVRKSLKAAQERHYIAVQCHEQVKACVEAGNPRQITIKAAMAAALGQKFRESRFRSITPNTTIGAIADSLAVFSRFELESWEAFDLIRCVEHYLGPIIFADAAKRNLIRQNARVALEIGALPSPKFAQLASANSPLLAELCPLSATMDDVVAHFKESQGLIRNAGHKLSELSASALEWEVSRFHDGLRFYWPFHEIWDEIHHWREHYIQAQRDRIFTQERRARRAVIRPIVRTRREKIGLWFRENRTPVKSIIAGAILLSAWLFFFKYHQGIEVEAWRDQYSRALIALDAKGLKLPFLAIAYLSPIAGAVLLFIGLLSIAPPQAKFQSHNHD